MSEKDFLSQFSSDGKKPDSFKEEERVKIEKPKKEVNPKFIIIGLIVVLALGVLSYFLFFAPKIEMPDFVGQTKDDVSAWVKQQGIETSGIIFKEEYNFDNDENVILSQDIEAGKKVKTNVKITFGLSLGADPDEKISFPDIKSMNKSELEEWISSNKLTKAKITTTYNDSVAEGEVISYEVKGVDEDNFTRSSTLNISVSKGPQPAGTVTVSDFVKKLQSEAETWAKSNKVTLNVVETYSETVDAGYIISQSVDANKTMSTKDTLTVYVSKGKGIKVPNFSNMSSDSIKEWLSKNGFSESNLIEKYSTSDKYVLSQSVANGTVIAKGDDLQITINKGKYFYAEDEQLASLAKVGQNVLKLEDWCNQKRSKGIDAYVGDWSGSAEVYSDTYAKGEIVSIEISSYSSGQTYSINDRLPLDVRFSVVVSKGRYYHMSDMFETGDANNYANVSDVISALSSKGISFTLDSSITDYNQPARIENANVGDDLYDDVSYKVVYANDNYIKLKTASSTADE